MKYGIVVLCWVTLVLAGSWETAGADVVHGGGTITEYTVWRASDNIHIVTGNYSVADGATLVIEAGCEVRFETAISITVYGGLVAPGTAANGILFTRRDPADEWSGLTFSSGSGGTLEYCTFEHATRYEGNAVYCNE
ncbi:MAG: hypothetical protein GY838_09235, partial [bacterium]|nr:hypothetical protein [bacterium]